MGLEQCFTNSLCRQLSIDYRAVVFAAVPLPLAMAAASLMVVPAKYPVLQLLWLRLLGRLPLCWLS